MYTAQAHHISLQSWDINWQALVRDGFRSRATGAYVLLRGALTIRPPRRDKEMQVSPFAGELSLIMHVFTFKH